MIELVEVYCPKCSKAGHKKLLMKVDAAASGTIYPFCKRHRNVEVVLPIEKLVPKCQNET